ncbi:MAG: hypothetical protein WA743_16605 [Pseudolabrys sp.]
MLADKRIGILADKMAIGIYRRRATVRLRRVIEKKSVDSGPVRDLIEAMVDDLVPVARERRIDRDDTCGQNDGGHQSPPDFHAALLLRAASLQILRQATVP